MHAPERLMTMRSATELFPGQRLRWRALGLLGLTLSMTAFTVSCSDADRSATRFCGSLSQALPNLTTTVASSDDIAALVRRFKDLNAITPVAIEEQWQSLTTLVELAADTDPLDPDSRQALADAAYRTERPARQIEQWVEATCGFQMPDVIGIEGPYVP